jgi:hypothetical protein
MPSMTNNSIKDFKLGDRVRVVAYGEEESFPVTGDDEFIYTEGIVSGFLGPYVVVSGIMVQSRNYRYSISHFRPTELEKLDGPK